MTITLHGTNGITTDGITLGSTAIASTGAEINILDGVTATATELNLIDGVTSTTAELNILDGVTSTTAELNILDGVTSTTAELNILDGVTSTAAELNILDGVTATAAEINLIDGGTARGTTALADGDGILINDAGTMRMSTVQTVKTYMTAGAGYWENLAEVTLGGSAVAQINITLPSGYDVHKLDIVFPRNASGNVTKDFNLINAGGSAQATQFTMQSLYSDTGSAGISSGTATNSDANRLTSHGGTGANDYSFITMEIKDANSSSLRTKYFHQGSDFGAGYLEHPTIILGAGAQITAGTIASLRFFNTGGHNFIQ